MLSAMRSGAQSIIMKIILIGLLVLAMAGLAIMDVQGMFRQGVTDTAVAKVGRSKISAAEFQRIFSSHLQSQGIPQSEAIQMGMPQMILARALNGRVYARAARDAGLVIDDVSAATYVNDMVIKPLVEREEGAITPEQALQVVLREAGMSESSLMNDVKTEMATDSLLGIVTSGTTPPQQIIQAALRFKYEERRGAYFTLSAKDAEADIATPSNEELESYYNTIAHRFALPEYRDFSVLVIRKEGYANAAPTAEELKAYYDAHIGLFKTPETRTMMQIVAQDKDTANAVLDIVRTQNKTLKAAAESVEGTNYIDAQTLTENDLPAELASIAFSAEAGTTTDPIESPLGWHVLHVSSITPGNTQTYEKAKDDIQKKLTEEKASESFYEHLNALDDM
ncbi:MAG: peptidyl-prolyl cis-trans isomerase, partial [Alphaproteobacteria bacterium]|nr:peptidyl-prolyl cis-trans isomerase [Alphaproteobacteria bacterium]